MKKRIIGSIAIMIILTGCIFSAARNSVSGTVKLNPKKPVAISIWHYYNGIQLQVFDEIVEEFNQTIGAEEGIIVTAHSLGNLQELTQKVNAAINEEVGAEEMPNIFSAYSDTAYLAEQKGFLADIGQYITPEEEDEYVDAYMEEGHLNGADSLELFPVAKSTENLLLNETAWEEFARETGADKNKLSTWEGIVELAEQYYHWTDDKTPDIENDGKAFFGRDAVANYMIIGSLQLGTELFQVNQDQAKCVIDEKVMRKLWDCYYVPTVNGWFGAYGKFRSDDIKTGQIICFVGSTSGGTYFPSEVLQDDGTMIPIKGGAYLLPNFEGTKPYAVQQGAGFVVTKSTKEKEYASTEFLKWFTNIENNTRFCVSSGYLPVKKAANQKEVLDQDIAGQQISDFLKDVIDTGVDITTNYTLYTSKVFPNSNEARNIAEHHIKDAADAAILERDAMLEKGISKEIVMEKLTGDEAFEEWLQSFREEMSKVMALE